MLKSVRILSAKSWFWLMTPFWCSSRTIPGIPKWMPMSCVFTNFSLTSYSLGSGCGLCVIMYGLLVMRMRRMRAAMRMKCRGVGCRIRIYLGRGFRKLGEGVNTVSVCFRVCFECCIKWKEDRLKKKLWKKYSRL